MSENIENLANRVAHDDVEDLYIDTVPESWAKKIIKKIKNVIKPTNLVNFLKRRKNKDLDEFQWEGNSPYDINTDFDDPIFDENKGGMRCASLSHILSQKKHGKDYDANRYFEFLKQAFEKEKMVFSEGDARLYFLILGLDKNVLSWDQVIYLFSLHPEYNEFFVDKESWKKDGFIVSKETPGAEQRGWTTDDVKRWKQLINPSSENGFFQKHVLGNLETFNSEVIQKSVTLQDRKERNASVILNYSLAA